MLGCGVVLAVLGGLYVCCGRSLDWVGEVWDDVDMFRGDEWVEIEIPEDPRFRRPPTVFVREDYPGEWEDMLREAK